MDLLEASAQSHQGTNLSRVIQVIRKFLTLDETYQLKAILEVYLDHLANMPIEERRENENKKQSALEDL